MRVHRLEVSAFGPFATTQVVDFELLNDAGVFLLTGPTGAGKTSILDAVCFALYGQVPGVRDKAKSYRSHHAQPADPPRVSLEVTLRGRRLRLTRQAAWSRPSRRARTGFVTEQARASAEELVDGRWVARSTRNDEVGDLVTGLLGLNREQFCQVVMLPQGDFQAFLRAGGQDRQRILESLFGTQRFQAVERWLKEHRAQQARLCRDHQERLRMLVARVEEAAGAPVAGHVVSAGESARPPLAVNPEDWPEVLDAVAELSQLAVLAAGEAASLADTSAAATKAARHRLDEASALAERQARHREATQSLTTLLAMRDLDEAREDAVRRARAAAPLVPLVELEAEAVAALAEHGRARVVAVECCAEVASASDGARPAVAEVEAAVDRLSARLGELEGLRSLESEREQGEQQADADEAALAGLAAEVARLDVALRDAPGEVAAAHGLGWSNSRQPWLVVTGVAEAQRAAGVALEAARGARRLEMTLGRLGTRRLEARERVVVAQQTWLDARERYLAGIAAELAAELRPGSACPVCGSASHPVPAVPAPGRVSRDEEAALLDDLDRARAELAVIDVEIATTERARGEALVASRGLDVAQATATELAARDAAAVVAAIVERDRLSAELDVRLCRRDADRSRRESAVAKLAALEARLGETRRRLAAVGARLADAIGPGLRVEDCIRDVDVRIEACRQLAQATRAEADDERRVEMAHRRLVAALIGSEFDTTEQVVSAALSEADLARAEALNRTHAGELAAVRRLLADPHLQLAAAEPTPDLDKLARLAESSAVTAAVAVGRGAEAARRLDRIDALLGDLAAGVDELAPLSEASRLADEVAGLCIGTSPDNVTRTALSHYVLAARLAQVVDAANVRLASICNGRYRLGHRLTRDAGDTRGGLGIVVSDTHTDVDRDPATLSGGETFYVSLSLALGLADVVCHEAGGAELSTLFVDEGFGALDDETRDEVLDELDALRSGGRVIGLVSHLSELRTRFPVQLRVIPTRRGSHCLTATLEGGP